MVSTLEKSLVRETDMPRVVREAQARCILGAIPLSLGFSRQECWSVLPCPPPGDFCDPGIKPMSPALQADSLALV